jgi:hypothetical protein
MSETNEGTMRFKRNGAVIKNVDFTGNEFSHFLTYLHLYHLFYYFLPSILFSRSDAQNISLLRNKLKVLISCIIIVGITAQKSA